MNIGDRVQSIYKGIPYIGHIVHMNIHSRIGSCIVTIALDQPIHVDGITLEKVYEQHNNLELAC